MKSESRDEERRCRGDGDELAEEHVCERTLDPSPFT